MAYLTSNIVFKYHKMENSIDKRSEDEKMKELYEALSILKNYKPWPENNQERRIFRYMLKDFKKSYNYVFKPIQVEQLEEVDELSKSILTKPKFRICTGSPKNGKTAFVYKLLLSLLKLDTIKVNPLFIGLDKDSIYDYWNNRISNIATDQRVVASFKKVPFIYPFSHTSNNNPIKSVESIIEDAITKNNYNIIIVDGFDRCFEVMSTDNISEFVMYLSSLFNNKGISILLNCRKEYPYFNGKYLNTLLEKWQLERPEYLEGDIVEWGQTRLTIKML